MIAHFKNENKLIITGADRAEALLISQLVDNAKSKTVKLSEFYDIDGDVNGFALELTEPTVEPTPEPVVEPEVEEPAENTEGE